VKATPNEFTSERITQALQLAAEKLPPKRVALVDAYVANGFNGAGAYKAAGYKVKGPNIANTEAAKILSNPLVSEYLCWKLRQVTAKKDCQIDEGRLIRESSALAYASLTDVLDWDKEGRVKVKASSEIPREVAAAIKKIKSTTRSIPQEDGPPIEETKIEIEMHDKKGALDLQARIAGMLRETKVADYSNYTLNMYFGEPPEEKEGCATNHSIHCQQSRSTLDG
jgi:hypothetical protein